MHSIEWTGTHLRLLDQRRLPHQTVWLDLHSHNEVAQAISDMVVRGAPAIAIAGGYGLAMALADGANRQQALFKTLVESRPTAVNLQWAMDRLSNSTGYRGTA